MSTLGHFIMTFFIAMLPVLELRGAIPIGTAAGLDPRLALVAAFLGNLAFHSYIHKKNICMAQKQKRISGQSRCQNGSQG